MIILNLLSLVLVQSASAGPVLNCNSFWKAYSGNYACEEVFPAENPAAGKYRFFHYSQNWTENASNKQFFESLGKAVKDTVNVYSKYGAVPPAYLVLVNYGNAQDTPDFVYDAMAFPQDRRAGEACPVLLYPSSKNMNISQLKQLIAHELFHCFQGENYPAQLNGPNINAVAWWVEGSADYFSNLVYPQTNEEWPHQKLYEAQSQPHLQTQTYSTSAFFQAIGNEPNLGPSWLASYFFTSMPKAGGANEQRTALSGLIALFPAFHHFAEQLITHTLPDTGGGVLPVPYDSTPAVIEVEKTSRSYSIPIRPWAITTSYFKLPPGAKFTFTNFREAVMKGGLHASLRRLPSTAWLDLSYADQTFDVTCDDAPVIVEVLITRTEDQGDAIATDVSIQAEEGPCSCDTEKGKIDPCTVGNWELDNDVFDQLFSQIMTSGEYIGTTGTLTVDVRTSKDVFFTFDRLANQTKTDVGLGPILIENVFDGVFQGKLGVTPSGKSCLKPISDGTSVKTIVHLGNGAPIENTSPNPLSAGGGTSSETDIACSANQIRYHVLLPAAAGHGDIDIEGVLHKISAPATR